MYKGDTHERQVASPPSLIPHAQTYLALHGLSGVEPGEDRRSEPGSCQRSFQIHFFPLGTPLCYHSLKSLNICLVGGGVPVDLGLGPHPLRSWMGRGWRKEGVLGAVGSEGGGLREVPLLRLGAGSGGGRLHREEVK